MSSVDQQAYQKALEDLQQADARHHLHPFTNPAIFKSAPPFIIDGAKGAYVTGQGVQLLDAMAGLGCVNIGYGRPEMAQAAASAIEGLSYYHSFAGITTPATAALAGQIAAKMPVGLKRIFFSNSGSEANETALKFIGRYWALKGKPEKRILISRHLSYHGSTIATTVLNGREAMLSCFALDNSHVRYGQSPFWYRDGGDMSPEEFGVHAAKSIEEEILKVGADKVAAIFAEPIQGTGGAIIPPHTYFPELQRIAKEHDVLLVADEVLTGMGRTGSWTASEKMGIDPDILTMAKGVSSAYAPISATVVHDRVMAVLDDSNGVLEHGFTTGAHPVACKLALANIEILHKENLVEKVERDLGPFLAERLGRLEAHPLVGEVRSMGMIAGVEIAKNKATREQFPIEMQVDERVGQSALLKGLIVRPTGNTVVLCPPFIITRPEIEFVAKTLLDALDEVYGQLKGEGAL